VPSTNNLRVYTIGGRTDNAGGVQTVDVDQEELRMLLGSLLKPGILNNALDQSPNPLAFNVRQDTGVNMAVRVGSGTAQRDLLVMKSTSIASQGSYLVRLEATPPAYTVPAADPTLPARYGVYCFIDDVAYAGDAARAYVDIACIRGTPNASPTTPGPLAVWSASMLLWEFQLPAAAVAVTNVILDSATSFDRRKRAAIIQQDFLETQVFS